jgi:catechol 2,3-dioxygenase-like lactoylglutathione lyase family enzyme
MPRIRHIAIGTQDPEATARFYIEGLGLKQVGRLNSATAEGYYLSDGHVNVAILKFKSEDPATTEGAPRYTGVHHFGLEVEDMKKARARFEKAGAVHRPYPGTAEMEKRGNVEVKFSGPDGVTIDLSEHGWLGTHKAPKRRRSNNVADKASQKQRRR